MGIPVCRPQVRTSPRAVALAESLREATARLQLPGFVPGEMTVSIGVAVAIGTAADPAGLVAQADERLYAAKSTRNAVATPAVALPLQDPAPALPAR